LIFGLVDGLDEVRIPALVLANNVRCVVGGSIIVDQYLDRKGCFLHEKAFKTVPNEALMVVSQAVNADRRYGAFGPRLFRDPEGPGQPRALVIRLARKMGRNQIAQVGPFLSFLIEHILNASHCDGISPTRIASNEVQP
jgi:hypothetical protein